MSDSRHPRVIAVTNQKGGVGKTTTTINLGAALASRGRKVLIVDLDPQGNASTGLGLTRSDRATTSYDLLTGGHSLAEAVRPTGERHLSIVPATPDLSSIDIELGPAKDRTTRLRTAIRASEPLPYDVILIDCPPSLNLLTVNALMASDGVLVPLQCEFFALEGITQLLRTIGEIRTSGNPGLRTEGIVLTMYDQRNRLTGDVEADVRENLGDLVYRTVIPRNVRLSEAPSHGVPALTYDPRSSGSRAYVALADELWSRIASGLPA